MKTLKRCSQRSWLSIILFCLISFFMVASYSFNEFKVSDPGWFKSFQLDSEQLVLDGILHARAKSITPVVLGFYRRGDGTLNHETYAQAKLGKHSGPFISYPTQYGLQVKIFSALSELGISVAGLKVILSIAMSLVVGLTYILLRQYRFSGLGSGLFASTLVLSPWVVTFSSNLYWIAFSLFIPIIGAAYLPLLLTRGRLRQADCRLQNMCILFVLFPLFLFRFLCGYEYITVIYSSSLVTFLLASTRLKASLKRIRSWAITLTISCILAFSVAIKLNIDQNLALSSSAGHRYSAMHLVQRGLARGFTSQSYINNGYVSPAEKECLEQRGDNTSISCIKGSTIALTMARVGATYLFIPYFYPWLHWGGPVQDPKHIAFILYSCLLACLVFRKPGWRLGVIGFFLSSCTWIIAALGHSSVHFNINFIVWYIIYIPFGALIIGEYVSLAKNKQRFTL
jgi:hypothetical protein